MTTQNDEKRLSVFQEPQMATDEHFTLRHPIYQDERLHAPLSALDVTLDEVCAQLDATDSGNAEFTPQYARLAAEFARATYALLTEGKDMDRLTAYYFKQVHDCAVKLAKLLDGRADDHARNNESATDDDA